ncbi:MAG TPA: tRNA pseudouridine(55) synthase TruB [Rhodothermia bacterium]
MNASPVDVPVLDGSSFPDDWREGVAVLVDKPQGWSSFRVVKALRSFTGVRRIGHAGTLDPMATGLLICCIGRTATRMIDRFVGFDKEYEGILRLGETTASFDAETPVEDRRPAEHLTEADLVKSTTHFIGALKQTPPMYSAVQIEGQRLYKLARKGVLIDRPQRSISVREFSIVGKDGRDVSFRVSCSKGTYIRTLVHDLGEHLGVGAHLIALRRTAIGPYRVDNALKAERLLRNAPE